MRKELEKKVNAAIKLLQAYKNKGPIEVCYSGGKDSDVILELTKMSGIDYRAIYKNTTIDPPGTIAHCKENGVEIMRPKKTFFELVREKGLPAHNRRFCCEYLKEYKVLDYAIQGIRRCESTARAKRYTEPTFCRIYGSKKNHVEVILPILEWTNKDVEDFVIERGIKLHPLYYREDGTIDVRKRLGCIGCPMSQKTAIEDFRRYPKMLAALLKAGNYWWERRAKKENSKYNSTYEYFTAYYFFHKMSELFEAKRKNLFGERVDCKKFLEEYFNIKL